MVGKTQTAREKLSISPQEFAEMGRVGAMYYQQGNFEKARTIFEGLVELDPENANAHSALGGLLTLQQDDSRAVEHLLRAIELNPSQIAPYVNLGEIYIRRQRIEDAVANLKQAIELDPDERDAGANRARAMVLGIYQVIKAEENLDDMNLATEEIN
ncbi:MAG TPA: tetratricopeptide repeat protein [Pyrinomonadaceae bacterium]|jgi:tetratricopeptide (TPR) repeat protein